MPKKVLVVGSGAREHAIALRLLESPAVDHVVVLPGNAGTARPPGHLAGKRLENAVGDPVAVARGGGFDLVVVGPEVPLCAGLVDSLAAEGVLAFGPEAKAARLEGSKAFMKEFAARHRIPTASYTILRDPALVETAVREFPDPPVVKADGLAAGKGVVVADSHEEAVTVARKMLSGELFGDSGKTVVLEQRLLGAEASVNIICDGDHFIVLPPAQDHKRIFDGDRGPNTGGMGTYAPAPLMTAAVAERVLREILEPAVLGMKADGMPYRGTLFAGLMIAPDGAPSLIEFNVRFGDPETQVLLNTTDGDLYLALEGAARGQLDRELIKPSADHAVCVVLAAAGYPETPRKGDVISGIERAERGEGVRVYHAGTAEKGGAIVTAGGRVLAVTARGSSLVQAHQRAYQAAGAIRFDGMQYRRDIAARALG
ncbi:MAG TPA: phosphoribosylamine--glycine ligase [Polyangiaceae bacterium]|nr:phosphoribosylamine--glycine ligase [Polyangiaceae bacterium]